MSDPIEAAIVRFRSPSGGVVGFGVLIDEHHVLTCAHVVNLALGRDKAFPDPPSASDLLRLEFALLTESFEVPERRARVDAWAAPGTPFEGRDVAGLALVGEALPVGARPTCLVGRGEVSTSVLVFGPVRGRPIGGWVPATLRPRVGPHRLQLDQVQERSFRAEPGFSGSPVVDMVSRRVVGLFVATATGCDETDAYAIPVTTLIEVWPSVLGSIPTCPYMGLEAFGEAEAHLFFGRDRFTDELEKAVDEQTFVPIVGASGVGKSSVVRAGLMPRLRRQEQNRRTLWTVVPPMRPGPAPFKALAAALAQATGALAPVPPREIDEWERRLRSQGVREACETVRASTGTDRVLLVIDQFEELVTQSRNDKRVEFLSELATLARRGQESLVVVLALREDYFGQLFVGHEAFGERLREFAIAIRGMSDEELQAAVEQPAAITGVHFERGLAEEIVNQARARPGALPLLEFTLRQLWDTLRPGENELRHSGYREIGELDGALASYADETVDALSDAKRAAVRRLFINHLIAPGSPDVRRRARRAEISPSLWPTVEHLARTRLLSTGRTEDGEECVDVAHEALLREWGKLRTWIHEEESFLAWKDRMEKLLGRIEFLPASLLTEAEGWLHERPDATEQFGEFVVRSREHAAAEAAEAAEAERYRQLYEDSQRHLAQAEALRLEARGRPGNRGKELMRAKELRTWEALGYETFLAYCREEFDIGRGQVFRRLHAWKVEEAISEAAGTPVSLREAYTREIPRGSIPEVAAVVRERTADADPEEVATIAEAVVREFAQRVRRNGK
ncbi:MAG: hypothetical protein QOD01_746 [Actinomycetota bacterium]|nr:hypothetical protein [Actinomycetota bacterium]